MLTKFFYNNFNESQEFRHHVWVDPQKHLQLNKLSAEILSLYC